MSQFPHLTTTRFLVSIDLTLIDMEDAAGQAAFLEALPEQIRKGCILRHAQIIAGGVDDKGVPITVSYDNARNLIDGVEQRR